VLWWECYRVLHKRRWNNAARYSVFPFSRRGSQTPPDMSSTYSTLRHYTTMPLQVRIEEGPRSKAVHVGGLQYCQYSQEKISLITLLLDHVYLLLHLISPVLEHFNCPLFRIWHLLHTVWCDYHL
jgi:hypothetical protein